MQAMAQACKGAEREERQRERKSKKQKAKVREQVHENLEGEAPEQTGSGAGRVPASAT